MLQVEVFAAAPAPPAALWALVGDLSRLPEWTDAEAVARVPTAPAVGDAFTTRVEGTALSWTVITVDQWLLEAKADTACGRVGIGVRAAPDPGGSRLILAGMLKPAVGALRARALEVPRLRRRFDAWSARAVRVVTGEAHS
jgi:hypothetical protein